MNFSDLVKQIKNKKLKVFSNSIPTPYVKESPNKNIFFLLLFFGKLFVPTRRPISSVIVLIMGKDFLNLYLPTQFFFNS